MRSILVLCCFTVILSGCFTKGSVTHGLSDQPVDQPIDQNPDTNNPQTIKTDFVTGEIVTTRTGFVIKGTFGEISEKKRLSNGYQIEGAFYE